MRDVLQMRDGWRFHEGDVRDTVEHGYMYTYMHTKTERGRGPASADYDDSSWRIVSVPHDYAVEHKPTPEANPVHGSLLRRQAWYRRNFRLEPADEDRRIRLWFEGICSRSHIWVNGCYMGFFDSAYTEIDLDITDIARYGDDLNTVAVYVDTTEYEGWWYEGAGIYRHVWLVKTDRISIERDGVYVHPEKEDASRWRVPVETSLENLSDEDREIWLCQKIETMDGDPVADVKETVTLQARQKLLARQEMTVTAPKLWSDTDPQLYRLQTTVLDKNDGEVILDQEQVTFGFRTIEFNAEKGFLLNGVPTKIRGMCIHEDHGGFGVAVPDAVKAYRVSCLKKMGCNGYRFSHNPHSRATLDACDAKGMLVMDENRWFESSENGLRRLKAMVHRDRNHPSVVIWSVGNEESLQAGRRGKKIMATMKAAIRSLDQDRPVLMAMHTGLLEEGAADSADMIGMNYNITLVPKVHERYPDKAIIFSEANSCNDEDVLGDRACGIETWKIVHETPYVCGLFAWTGMDYRGEHDYPGLFALCGAMDQNGYPKESYSLYQSWWQEKPLAKIEPNRNPNCPDNQIRLVGNGDQLILYRDGEKIYETKTQYYAPAELTLDDKTGVFTLETLKNGKVTATDRCVLEGTPAKAELIPENPGVRSGCQDVAVCTLRILDEHGLLLPDAALAYEVQEVKGGKLLLTGNGDVQDASDRHTKKGMTYRGLAQLLIEPQKENVAVKVKVSGLKAPAILEFTSPAGTGYATCETVERRYITDWEMADWTPAKPVVEKPALDSLAGYKKVEVGHGTQMHDLYKDSGFLTYHTVTEIPVATEAAVPHRLYFELLEGKSDVLVFVKDADGQVLKEIRETKAYEEPGELSVEIPLSEGAKTAEIYVCLEVFMPFCGITKPVRWYVKN